MNYLPLQRILALGILLLLVSPAYGSEIEYRLNLGILTEHYYHDQPEYNEDSKLIQFTIAKGPWAFTGGIFDNSYDKGSHFLGFGYEYKPPSLKKVIIGNGPVVVKGYEKYENTLYKGLIILPVSYVRYNMIKTKVFNRMITSGVRTTIFGSAINVSLEAIW